jgi:hypothetical protein
MSPGWSRAISLANCGRSARMPLTMTKAQKAMSETAIGLPDDTPPQPC